RVARMMFLTGAIVDDPAASREGPADAPKKGTAKVKLDAKAPPAPKFSARGQLVEIALRPGQNDYFAKAIVNRLWYRLFGHGLVMPLDQMHTENPPSHPELLQWLARDTVEHGYDLRRLIRGLVQSRAYARSSRWDQGDLPNPRFFAVGRLRALAPMQLAAS